MHFPSWIDTKRQPAAKRAQLRLKYMISAAALQKWGDTSVRKLAAQCGFDHSSIFNAINRGFFTESMALSIERVFGRDVLQHEWLMHPLEVGRVAA